MNQHENESQQPNRPNGLPLRDAEAEQLARHISEITSVPLPLAEGLRVAAAEQTNRKLTLALQSIATQLEAGKSLAQILDDKQIQLPPYYRGLISAAVKSERLSDILSESIEFRQRSRELWREVYTALAYPALVLGLTAMLWIFFASFVAPPFKSMFEDFGLTLPTSTIFLFWWCETGLWIFLGTIAAGILAALLIRLFSGAARWRRIMSTVPLLGPMGHWTGIAEMTRLLALLLEQQIPLPEALRQTADGLSDANLRQACADLANQTEQGTHFSESIENDHRLPCFLVPLVQWGERSQALPEALRTAGEVFENRVRQRASIFQILAPPWVFLLVGVSVASMIGILMLPLLDMISGLSY